MCPEYENSHFSHISFEHGYLTYYSTYLLENLYVYSLDEYGGKGVSIFLYIGLSFYFIEYRRWKLGKKYKQSQKLPVFCHKIRTKAYTKNLRQPSLDKIVLFTIPKLCMCR